jgi:hypothetical protein
MKLRILVLMLPAAVAVGILFAAPASAAYPIVNPSFETGTFFGWTVAPAIGGSAQVLPGSAPYNGSGSYYAKLTPGQQNVYTTVSQTVSAAAGSRLAGWAYFENHDGEFGFYCDDAYVKVNGTTVFHGNSCTTGTTPWIHWSYTVPAVGSYTIQSGVDNVGDSAVPSFLFVDDFRYLGPYKP